MHWFDISVIVLLITSTLYSLLRGLIKELFSLASIIFAFILAHRYYSFISTQISDFVPNKMAADLLSFGFIFIFSALIISQIGKLVRNLLYETKTLTVTDRVGGSLLGLIKGILIITVIMIPIGLIPYAKKEIIAKAKSAPYILNLSRELSKVSFSDKNILENVQSKLMKNMKNMQDKLNLPDVKDKIKTGIDTITGSLKDMGNGGDKKDRVDKSKKESSKKHNKKDDKISERITEEAKKNLDSLIDKNL
jgi:membrane protein required for colicin V production